MGESNTGRVFGLDFMRAVAILGVVLAHSGLVHLLVTLASQLAPGLAASTFWLGLLSHAGLVGVEIFFVLSGFLIGGILLRSAESLGTARGLLHFYARRWFRTLPLFWLFIFLNVLLERFLRDRSLNGAEVLAHAFFLRNFDHVALSFFPESWSLAVEEWFYLLFPATLWAGLRLAPKKFGHVFLISAGFFLLVAVAARCRGALQPDADWVNTQRCTVLFRFDALMAGVLAAWVSRNRPELWRRAIAPGAVAGVLLFALTYGGLWTWSVSPLTIATAPDTFFARTFRFLLFPLGFALLLPLASQWAPVRDSIWHTAVRKTALWSYALYLVNWPLIQILSAPGIAPTSQSWPVVLSWFGVKVGVAFGISALLYRFYEAPCTRLREKLPWSVPRAARAIPA
jgi:peptidoglycan/LPS O-acetylase OafA/YrhL